MAQEANTQSKELTVEGLKKSLISQNIPKDKIQGNDNFLAITPPGINIGEIRQFLKGTFSEFGKLGDMIPDSLPIDGVTLQSLKFASGNDTDPYLLQFTIAWASAKWEMIPGVIELESPSIGIEIFGGNVSGSVSGIIEIENIPLLVEVDLPEELVTVKLVPPGKGETQSAADLLQKFQASPNKATKPDSKGVNLGNALTLQDLTLLGSIKSRRALFHLALGQIKIGPGEMGLQLSIDYTGGTNSNIKGSVYGEYDIKKQNDPNTNLLSLTLLAEYDGPEQGWLFQGSESASCSIGELVTAFDKNAKDIPGFLNNVTLKFLNLSYNTGTQSFSFSCEVDAKELFGDNTEADLIISIDLIKSGTGYEKTFKGQLIFELDDGFQMEFDLLFNNTPAANPLEGSESTFIAAYKNLKGGKINIGKLTRKIDPSFYVPLTIDLEDAFFVYDKKSNATAADFLFGLDVGSGINLSNLPLIGKIFPKDQTMKIGIQPLIASGPRAAATPGTTGQAPYFSTEELSKLSNMVPGGGVNLPTKEIKEAVSLGINLDLGEKSFHFDIPIQLNSSKSQPKTVPKGQEPPAPEGDAGSSIEEKPSESNPAEPAKTETSPGTVGTTPPAPGSGGGNIQWLNIQKAFGPVQFNRIGLQYADKKIWAFLDAGLNLAGLTLTLDGLGVGTPIDKLKPEFKLLGVSVDYQQGPVEIGASFLRYNVKPTDGTPPYDEYDGIATIKADIINVSAIGSYAKVDGHDSLFIYAVLDMPIGGPPFFFVMGIAAGFGYNRAVKMPDIANVGQFPLVNQAVGGEGSPIPSGIGARRNYLQNEITQLRDYIYPKPGEYFLTAGLRFSTFELIDSFAMVIVSFGQDFELDILGLSTLIVPTPEEGQSVSPLAEVQLALKATFAPAEGFLGIQAQLTSNSFLLSRSCHLTGGFAFFCWFGGPHEGDFVVSLGGYHPKFQKPAWYPTVPRIGFNWIINSHIFVKGDFYFALCSHALMAGGGLQAVFHLGGIKAWFIIGADFIISWKPYFYDAEIYLDMGVSVTFWLFGRHTITIHLGADLHVWGPDFSGKARVHLWIITFTVSFGSAAPKPRPIDWPTFKSSFLPDISKVCSISVTNGLIKNIEDQQKNPVQVINPKDFKLLITTTIPFSIVTIESADKSKSYSIDLGQLKESSFQSKEIVNSLQWDKEKDTFVQADSKDVINTGKVGVAPMALDHSVVKSTFHLTTAKKDDQTGEYVYLGQDFAFTPVLKRMPAAMWGDKLTPGVNSQKFIENAVAGFEIRPATPSMPGETHPVPKKDLQYTTNHIENAYSFETVKAFNADSSVSAGTDYIRQNIATQDTMKKRRSMIEALGFNYSNLDISLTEEIADDFVRDPQVGEFA
ncbi:MAG: hypothetical protein DWQ02_07050 [Bacteroidetes bacterium]|nr:MAG: hypothetical protein DWQ02_07050 [Bacteroidota bacterium]